MHTAVIQARPADAAGRGGALDEPALIEALRRGDEGAFAILLDRFHPAMVRFAWSLVGDRAVAEDVAQEAWLGVVQGLSRFEARSTLKTWIFRILANCARTRTRRERHSVPFSALWDTSSERSEPPWEQVEWRSAPHHADEIPDARILLAEMRDYIRAAIDTLPDKQRAVITLRDIECRSANEVCALLDVTDL